MTGSVRYLIAAAFVVLYFLVPDADANELAQLELRSWLMGSDSPFLQLSPDPDPERPDVAPPAMPSMMTVSYQAQGADLTERKRRAEGLARTLREWTRGKERATDASLPIPLLEVIIGSNGYQAVLKRPDGTEIGSPVKVLIEEVPEEESTGLYPSRTSLLPAFLAIILAIATSRVIPSLLLGCLAGAVLYQNGAPLAGLGHFAADTIWQDVLQDSFKLEILGFVLFLFMTVGVMARSGGVQGMVEWIRRFAKGPVSTQLCSFAIGLLIFFDDYSNCIITGTTMRPLTDRNGIAREKLAYIVDSTAAPIAGVSIFSTWVAYEVSTFALQLPEVTKANGAPYTQADGFAVFLETLPFRFYCLFTLLAVLATILLHREFGPMLRAARRAWHERKPVADDATPMGSEGVDRTEPPEGAPLRGLNALLPILLLVVMTIALIFVFGLREVPDGAGPRADGEPLFEYLVRVLGAGQSQKALFWASLAALILAVALAVGQGIISFVDAVQSAVRSARALLFAVIILILAWAIGQTCKDLGTATYLTAAFQGSFPAWLLPVVMFLLSSLVAFSTGTSYGTMAILLPNVVVLAHGMGETMPDLGGPVLMVLTIGAVLEGSIFGDHCSPISDTTVLSSVASGSDHLHHVRTQAPYALLVMGIAIACGYIPAALLGPSYWPLCWGLGAMALVAVLLVFGRRPTDPAPAVVASERAN